MKCLPILILSTLTAPAAWATGTPASAPTPSTSHASADSRATSSAHSAATAAASQTQTASGSATQSQTAQGGNSQAVNSGNNADQSVAFDYPKLAPSVGQGSLMIGSCGAGGNAGGSNSNGAAFLGIAYTPADCKLLLAAAAYQALGMWDSACEMVNGISAVKARWKALGVSAPSCRVSPPVPVVPPVAPPVSVVVQPPQQAPAVDLSTYATKAELEAAFKRSVGK